MSLFRELSGILVVFALLVPMAAAGETIEVSRATVVTSGKASENTAKVLVEEVEKRTGVRWTISGSWPDVGPAVGLVSGNTRRIGGESIPDRLHAPGPEGYAVLSQPDGDARKVWVLGADARGLLFGVGYLLRQLDWREGSASLPRDIDIATSPKYPIRGHQLGYRATANSYDAWDAAQFDQYVRELALFGANCVEGIPFHDDRPTVASHPRRDMNRELSKSCARYDLDYWIWAPADFDLADLDHRAKHLDAHKQLFADCPRLDAVFFPGGDPGDNSPDLVMPYLDDLSRLLHRYHPRAKIWVSLQGFNDTQVDRFYALLDESQPEWMAGLVAGPSSPSIAETRARLDKRYGLRHYPDITHNVRAQYAVPWIDPALAFTLGREPVNPRPVYFTHIHNEFAPYTNGFLAYSDGIHDDVNKTVWSALGWDTNADMRTVMAEYARLFFGHGVAETAADGILAFEQAMTGPLALNGGVDGNLALWNGLEAVAPQLAGNWRWQQCLLRANYDAYVRHRLINESALEATANARMLEADHVGADAAIDAALAVLKKADGRTVRPELRERVVVLCESLFKSIGLQTSVAQYGASGAERGAVLDYVDYPLNNRWWIEDELAKVRAMATEQEKCERLRTIAAWEDPGPGGFYDDIGNVAKSPNVIRGEEVNTLAEIENAPIPDYMWWDSGMRRVRQSWVSKMDWPLGLRYTGLDAGATYVLRTTGNRDCLPRANGIRLVPTLDGKELGDIKEFPIPSRAYRGGAITVTFDVPFEPGMGWRESSRLNEVWLIKR